MDESSNLALPPIVAVTSVEVKFVIVALPLTSNLELLLTKLLTVKLPPIVESILFIVESAIFRSLLPLSLISSLSDLNLLILAIELS